MLNVRPRYLLVFFAAGFLGEAFLVVVFFFAVFFAAAISWLLRVWRPDCPSVAPFGTLKRKAAQIKNVEAANQIKQRATRSLTSMRQFNQLSY